ncbi:MAG TPA: phosphoribosylanthranilate isomerase [Novosphingobium sp.]|nr:phosphoribosylanthranilate isomerase [Novosphingobium sp.]
MLTGPKIKICGIDRAAALDAAIAARADYVGLVFVPGSPRNLTLADAAALAVRADGRIGKVGLFVDADEGTIARAIDAAGLDAIQLHGSETPVQAARLRARFGLPVWKALAVTSRGDLQGMANYSGAADLILFDAKTPPGALPGGSGLAFDWSVLAGYRGSIPWGLAGGLAPGNVAEAVRVTRAPLVDVSSGVESAPGVKDVDSIAAFCKAARGS